MPARTKSIIAAIGSKILISLLTKLTLLADFVPGFVPPRGSLRQEAQNVQAPEKFEQAVQFVGQIVHTPDELKY